jgi:hypothetical protein
MEQMIELNVTVLTRLTYGVVPAFVARGGTIINISRFRLRLIGRPARQPGKSSFPTSP